MQEVSLEEILDQIVAKDTRYHREAYYFIKDALDHTQKLVNKTAHGRLRHVTGQELLEGIREYALSQFGPMTGMVFEEWGIHHCQDFGEIVFNMVENKLLSITDQDSRDDFKGGYDFDEAFRMPFLPSKKTNGPVKPAVD